MQSYLGLEEQALRKAAGEVLHYVWDPVGVAGVVSARDEYEGYVEGVCSLIWSGANGEIIAEFLVRAAEEGMGILDTRQRAEAAGTKLLEWRDAITR